MNENTSPPARRWLRPESWRQHLRRPLTRRVLLSLAIASLLSISLYLTMAGYSRPATATLPANDPRSDVGRATKTGAEGEPATGQAPAARDVVPTQAPAGSRWAVLLLGYGGSGHDGAYLTDSMTLAIADPAQKTLTLLSIPRDCWVPLLFDGTNAVYNKLNTAFALAGDSSLYPNRLARYAGRYGQGNFAKDTVSQLLGVPIANYLGLDFAGFRGMIDAVGGIDVDVPASFSAVYPANDDASVDPSWKTVRFRKGTEHMNGERAIAFARAREVFDNPSESNDFARARRQQLIMEAFKARLLEPAGLIHLPQLLAAAASHVDTDYAIPQVSQLSQLLLDWKSVSIYQTALTAGNFLEEGTGPGGSYVLVPSADGRSWAQIRAFTRRLWENPALGVAMADTTVVVVNKTGQPALAGRLSAALSKLGYRVAAPRNGAERPGSRLVGPREGSAALVAAQLAKDLGLSLPEAADTVAAAGEVVLELGADDAELANFEVAADDTAPSSAVGLVGFGWSMAPAGSATAVPTATPKAADIPEARPTPLLVNGRAIVPPVVGLSEAAARAAIDAAGLSNTYTNYQGPGDVPPSALDNVAPGHVLSQRPAPGELLPAGATVFIAVRKP